MLLQSLYDTETPEGEWWRRMCYMQNAAARNADTALLEALDEAKEKIKGSRFPVQEVTTLQNLPLLSPRERQQELNYFAPTKNLQILLKQSWFKELRTKDEYDEAWTDAFASALMTSEGKDSIAADWAVQGERSKINQIKGYVIGLLKDAGVLKGSYDSISTELGITEDPRTFSKYMGEGKKQPYADWVKGYVNGIAEQ